jgi:hypothetical protein
MDTTIEVIMNTIQCSSAPGLCRRVQTRPIDAVPARTTNHPSAIACYKASFEAQFRGWKSTIPRHIGEVNSLKSRGGNSPPEPRGRLWGLVVCLARASALIPGRICGAALAAGTAITVCFLLPNTLCAKINLARAHSYSLPVYWRFWQEEAPLQVTARNYAPYAKAAIPLFDLGLQYRVDP